MNFDWSPTTRAPWRTLMVVTSDPRTTSKTAEAIRIAAGLGVWGTSKLSLYCGLAMVEAWHHPGSICDAYLMEKHLPELVSELEFLLIPEQVEIPRDFPVASEHCRAVSVPNLAGLISRCRHVMHY